MKPLEFIIEGPPVAYVRMNSQNIWTERVQNYLAYKDYVSSQMEKKYPEVIDRGPETKDKKARAAWLKQNKNNVYRLEYVVYEEREKSDFDNYGKLIADALQDAGMVSNDKKIKVGTFEIKIDKDRPRLEIRLWKL